MPLKLQSAAALSAAFLAASLALLSGCATSAVTPSAVAVQSGASGQPDQRVGSQASPRRIHGQTAVGPKTIVGAHIYLFAANTAFYGAQSVSLLNPADSGVATDGLGNYVLSNAAGGFGFSYHCAPGQLVYILSYGGSPSGQGWNPGVTLLSVFGVCPAAGDFSAEISFIDINQVSTVVGVYALAGYMSDFDHVSSAPSAQSQRGLANAFAAVGSLMDIQTGVVFPYTPSSGVVPQQTINSLANLLIPCSNDFTACASLFSNAQSLSGVAPAETVQALLNILHNPSANLAALFAMGSNGSFQPALASAPNDWTLGITYFAENMAGPYFPAFDASGNLWVPGYANNTLTEFDPLGNLLSGAAGFSGGGLAQPFSVAIDSSGNAWVSNFGAVAPGTPSLSEFAPNGTAITSNGFGCGTACSFLAIDGSDNLWVSGAPQVSVVRNSGVALSAFSSNGAASGIAIDSQGRGWAIGSGRNLSRLTVPGSMAQFSESVTTASGTEANAIAIDAADNIWVASPKNNALGEFSNSGTTLSPPAGYTGGGLHTPSGLAVDGDNKVWVANRDGNSISVFSNSGTPISGSAGYTAPGVSNPRGIAVDPSGNVWITNFTGNAVTEFLGAATPSAAPLSPHNHGLRP